MGLYDIIKEKQENGETLLIRFKDGTRFYFQPDDEVKKLDEEFYHFKAKISLKGKLDTIRNIREIVSIDPLGKKTNKKIPNRKGAIDGQE